MSFDLDHILNHISLKKSRNRWRWIAIGLLIAGLVAIIMSAPGQKSSGPHIARIYITGLITGDDKTLSLIKDIRANTAVKALIVHIDSPGGTTVGSEAIYEELLETGKVIPVASVMNSVAASGGYITALATDHIVARKNTITGSIGVIFSYPDVSAMLNSLGVKFEEIKSAELKAEPSPYKPTSEKARAATMVLVQDGFSWFKSLVAERRKFDALKTAAVSDGRVFSGTQAKAEGLIDSIGDEDEAVSWIKGKVKDAEDLKVETWEPPREEGWEAFFFSATRGGMTAMGLEQPATPVIRPEGLLVMWRP